MKKRILIMNHAMELGGAERSLLGLLDSLDPDLYDIDLFLLRHEGELLGFIPEYVNLLPAVPAYTVLARPMKDTLKEGHLLLTSARLAGKLASKHYDSKHKLTDSGVPLEYSHKYTCPFMPDIQPDITYDAVISFLTPHYFAVKKVNARKRIAWIHTDYSHVQIDVQSELKMWQEYDHIVSISEAAAEGFKKVFPSLGNKIVIIENILPERLIRKQAEEGIPAGVIENDGKLRLLSVGRYCTAKNFDNVPEICSLIRNKRIDIKWYIIGFGGDESLIRNKIKEFHMEDHVILLGKKDNPYPYIKECDIYVQPSRYEGKCVSVREAQMLCKPVIITRYATSSSQLEDGIDGVIVPMDNEGCAQGIADVIRDKELLKTVAGNCSTRDYSNRSEVTKVNTLIQD